MSTKAAAAPAIRAGRGARERILQAAGPLFYKEGIQATGIARLVEAAHVSTRTFYQHFPSKNALVEAYLERIDKEEPHDPERQLLREDLGARERLLALFEPMEASTSPTFRGCPFHNAAVEAAGTVPEVAELVRRHKMRFRHQLIDAAKEAGAADPQTLGTQLSVIFEGAAALATSCNDTSVATHARALAAQLIDMALADVK
ncbi:TetR/AcrR family transcriptional regulator [Streptomyces mexicanus]|uniref:TetR/AcrR family transcriptional regulator n=1 Tax=Streptomyces mexicanus TaxID=178566 RepID=UPI00367519EF